MASLAVPGPFDLALTTERFRAFGLDRTAAWHEGGLHVAAGERELRIEASPGGVDVDPLDAETEPVVRTVLGLAFDLEPFYAWAAADEVLGPATRRLRGFRPTLSRDPFEMIVGAITAQQVSLQSAGATRNRLSSGSARGSETSGPFRRASESRQRARKSSARSASRAGKRNTPSGSPAPMST
jgi:3-methyladenine DNA glycosylase/8-oxoguanine DNA glycosylase